MKKLTIFLFLLLICSASNLAAQSKNKNIEQELMRLHLIEEKAESKQDIAVLNRLFNDDFIFIAANGSVSDKKKFLEEIKGESDNSPAAAQKLTYENFKVRVYGTTAVVNYILVVSGKDKDAKDYSNRYQMSAVWIKQKNNWRISNFHVTRVRS